MAGSLQQLRLFVEGRVQGVGFRYHTRNEALRLGLCGWVRNLRDGRVEILAQGDAQSLNAFRQWCAKGPAHAQVSKLAFADESLAIVYKDFSIDHTP